MIIGSYSGGAASHVACMKVKPDVLLFADTGEESPELYEFIEVGAKRLQVPLVTLKYEGGMDACIDTHKALPSSHLPFCSQDLKIKVIAQWIKENATSPKIVIGYTWDETNRIPATRDAWLKVANADTAFPLTERPYLSKPEIVEICKQEGLPIQSLYERNYPHNNCGGACVKAGISQWKRVLLDDPERFAKWESREKRISELHGKTYSVLKRYGRPYPLSKLKADVEANRVLPDAEWGGCGCFSDGLAQEESNG